jgi:hypothetical protein
MIYLFKERQMQDQIKETLAKIEMWESEEDSFTRTQNLNRLYGTMASLNFVYMGHKHGWVYQDEFEDRIKNGIEQQRERK